MAVYETDVSYVGEPFPTARVRGVPQASLKIGSGKPHLPPGAAYDLDPRHDLWNHSPDGFSWGYGGSGAAQLALAILADFTGDDHLAFELHQLFERKVIARLAAASPFRMEASTLRRFLRDPDGFALVEIT